MPDIFLRPVKSGNDIWLFDPTVSAKVSAAGGSDFIFRPWENGKRPAKVRNREWERDDLLILTDFDLPLVEALVND